MTVPQTPTRLGVVFTADRRAEELKTFAIAAEAAGMDELWLWEDCFFAGGIAATAAALAATQRITVGLGVMPATFRNPVVAAMEIATLARLYPGRLVAGLGHGDPGWMEQIGALPGKPMRALEEISSSVRRLLAGDRFSLEGDFVHLRDVKLERPPQVRPPLVLGVRRRLGLQLSGRCADGTILAEPSPPSYIRWAYEKLEEGRSLAGRDDPHQVTVFVKGRVDADRCDIRDVLARLVLSESAAVHLAFLDRDAEIEALRSLDDPARIASNLPDDLIDSLAAAGTAEQVISSLRAIQETGVDAITFVPVGPAPEEQLRLFASEVMPALR